MARGKQQETTGDERLQQALVPVEDQPYEVPGNWEWVRLGSIAEIKGGKRLPSGHSLVDNKTSNAYIRVTDFANGSVALENVKYILPETFIEISKYTISVSDIYISIAGSIGKVGIIPDLLDGSNLTENAAKITNIKGVYQKYLLFLLQSDELQNQMKSSTIATTQAKLALFRIEKLAIPIPPFPEQYRIGERIKSLFAKLDAAKELVQAALESFESRKAAILHKAFKGELTAKWREEHGVGMDSWEEKSFSEVVELMQNGISKRSGTNGIPTVVLRLANIEGSKISSTDFRKIILDPTEIAKYSLVNNDALIIRVNGSFENVGKVILVDNSEGWAFCDHLIKARFSIEKVLPKFMIYLSKTDLYRKYIEANMVSSAGQNTISQKSLEGFCFSCPTLPEQQEIVYILDSVLEKQRQAKELIDILDEIDLMKKAILSRAFRGELGTNDPHEESAIHLLKQIRKGV